MKISGPWITARSTQAVCAMLTDAGHQALLVGGCVRNALLGAPVGDIDIATDAEPTEVIALARRAGLKPVPTGIEHGTITVIADHIPHEVTTFREDVETFGRHAVVAYSSDLHADARRRDFTMNALYAAPDGTLRDPVNGMPDLRAGHVRFIGDADARIREDYLRILRFFRFTAWYGEPSLGIDADGIAACAENLDGLPRLSAERVGAEMRKLLCAADPSTAVASMAMANVLTTILPGASAAALPVLVHLEDGILPDPIRRLAVLGGEDVAERLRLSNAERKRLDAIRAGLETDLTALGYRFPDTAMDTLLVRAALMGQPVDPDDIVTIQRGQAAEFPVKAADLMPEYKGAALGAKLRALEVLWIDSAFTMGKDALLAS